MISKEELKLIFEVIGSEKNIHYYFDTYSLHKQFIIIDFLAYAVPNIYYLKMTNMSFCNRFRFSIIVNPESMISRFGVDFSTVFQICLKKKALKIL